jgi:hypothetical protein
MHQTGTAGPNWRSAVGSQLGMGPDMLESPGDATSASLRRASDSIKIPNIRIRNSYLTHPPVICTYGLIDQTQYQSTGDTNRMILTNPQSIRFACASGASTPAGTVANNPNDGP